MMYLLLEHLQNKEWIRNYDEINYYPKVPCELGITRSQLELEWKQFDDIVFLFALHP